MRTCRTVSRAALVGLVAVAAGCGLVSRGAKAPSREALRHTPLVEVFERCKDSVVRFTAVRVEDKVDTGPDGKGPPKRQRITHTQWGSGCILHEAGYILSNSHMLAFTGERTASLYDGKSYPVRVVAADETNDLALLKVEAGRPLKPLRLGRSATLRVGEPAITIGNPFGLGFTMASGIISALGRNTKTEYTFLADMIQTDASINPGCSGGPLLNILGEVVGLCTTAKIGAENIGFGISVDRVRAVLRDLLSPEARYGFILGIEVAKEGPAKVTGVAKGSPAEAAGVKAGDVITAIAKEPVRNELDFSLALLERKAGQALPLKLLRGPAAIECTATLKEVKLRPAEPGAGLVGGLDYKHYRGMWKELPDFDRLKPAATGTLATFGLGPFAGKEAFGMKYTGYIEVPADGVYIFSTRSDDGSRLYVGSQLVVDNDGLHGVAEKRGFISLKAGRHPLTVTYFQGPGEAELRVFYEGPGVRRQEIPSSALFRPAGQERLPQPASPRTNPS